MNTIGENMITDGKLMTSHTNTQESDIGTYYIYVYIIRIYIYNEKTKHLFNSVRY